MLLLYRCYFAVAAKMNVPIIGTVTVKSWSHADHEIGNPNNPSYIPYDLIGSLDWRSFYDRLQNTCRYIISQWYWHFVTSPVLNELYKNHSQQLGPAAQYNDIRPSLVFINNHVSLLPRTTTPNAIEIGGIHIKEAKPLPQVRSMIPYFIPLMLQDSQKSFFV